MSKNNFTTNILIYLFLYISLLTGFFLNEDLVGGFQKDFEIHKMLVSNLFNNSFIYGLLNYDIYYVPHSPIYIIYIAILKKILLSYDIVRLINLHICLILPLTVALIIKLKFNKKKFNDPIFLLPTLFFISPFFRSGSIWIDDNIFALIFFTISTYFYLKFEDDLKKTINLFMSILFMAVAAYMRPVYCIFSIYFFIRILLFNLNTKTIIEYIIFNIILSLPAFYYFFILDINKWAFQYLNRENFFTIIFLTSSVIGFYLLPFIYFYIKKVKKRIFNLKNIIFIFIMILINFIFFEYNRDYSGGIFFKISNILFNSNYLFYLISSLILFFLFFIFKPKSLKDILDLLLITVLFFLEIDGVIYHETYDPLLLILIISLFKNPIFLNVINSFSLKYYSFIFIYYTLFLLTFLVRKLYL